MVPFSQMQAGGTASAHGGTPSAKENAPHKMEIIGIEKSRTSKIDGLFGEILII
jgi:hypothetical protein